MSSKGEGKGAQSAIDKKYAKIKKLGEGTYGVVYQARDRESSQIVALKCIRLESVEEGVPCTAIREISLLKELCHPCIVRLFAVDHEDNTLTLVFEYLEMDLKHYMDSVGGRVRLGLVKSYTYQLLLAVAACHERKILHRDLKPQNLLLNVREGELKLADFGLARAFGIPVKTFSHEVVTLWYRAPDVLLGSSKYGPPIDIWSTGCIMAEMAHGLALFPGSENSDELLRIFKVLGTPTPATLPGLTDLPEYSGNLPQYAGSPLEWAVTGLDADGYDLLKQMLVYDPSKRVSAVDALKHPFFAQIDLPASVIKWTKSHTVGEAPAQKPNRFRFGG